MESPWPFEKYILTTENAIKIKINLENKIMSNLQIYSVVSWWPSVVRYSDAGIILYMCSANEKQGYNVTSSLISWAYPQEVPWWPGLDPICNWIWH